MVTPTVGAAIFIGRERDSAQEKLVDRALRASAIDLIGALHAQGFRPVVLAGPDLNWAPDNLPTVRDIDAGVFHFGARLAAMIECHAMSSVVYFGAGSAPLLSTDALGAVRDALSQLGEEQSPRVAVTNNLHSSDWVGISRASDALGVIRQADRDNSLAWMLQESQRYSVQVLADARTSSGMDLDTPTDLAVARMHPHCPPHLADALRDPLLDRIPVARIVDVIARDGSRVALIGRVAPLAWQALSDATQAWIRVYSEERGMVASERLARGEVRTLIGTMVDVLGPDAFFEELAAVADVALIDTRVMMAASGHFPAAADRFASDLFLVEAIKDGWLRAFTAAAAGASLPVLLGGHGVVAGGLYALADVVRQRRR